MWSCPYVEWSCRRGPAVQPHGSCQVSGSRRTCAANRALAPKEIAVLLSRDVRQPYIEGLWALITPGNSLVAKQRKACYKGPFVERAFVPGRGWLLAPLTSHQPSMGRSYKSNQPSGISEDRSSRPSWLCFAGCGI